jgi:trimethylamine-N-oxide reductase (cytochrome c)
MDTVVPGADSALQLAMAYIWIDEDTYDKDYVETHM